MQVLDILRQAQGGRTAENLAREYGVEPSQAVAVLDAVVPEIAWNLERNTLSRGGLADLVAALGAGHHEGFLNDPNIAQSKAARDEGGAILGHVLGSKDKSRSIAAYAARQSGVGEAVIKAMLPSIAAMVMGALASSTKASFGDILSRLPGGGGIPGAPSGGRPLPWPGSQEPGSRSDSGQAPLPMPWPAGEPGRGEPAGEGMASQSPLPLPSDRTPLPPAGRDADSNPYGDLSDILRKGGSTSDSGDVLWNVVRGVLGSVLGFQAKGVFGWLLRLLVVRFGWSVLRTILGRVLLGR